MNATTAERFSNRDYRIIALAATAQCALLVSQLAARGRADEMKTRACVDPLLILDPDSTAQIFPDVRLFNDGLTALQQSFGTEGNREFPQAARYFLGMTVLQQKLMANRGLQSRLRTGLEALKMRPPAADSDEPAEDAFPYADVSRLYQSTISTLSYRIQITGEQAYLENQAVADRVRSLLLAGIRAAVLWHQLGGRRWHLLFQRKQMRESITRIRRSLISAP